MRVPDDYRFDGSSPVGRYWLIHGVGFTVCRHDGRKLGVVEEVIVDQVRQNAERVIVRRRGLVPRLESLDPELVEAVVPGSQLFLVESPAPEPAVPSHPVAKARARSAAAAAGSGLRAVDQTTRRAGTAARPHALGLLRALAAAVVLAARATRQGAVAYARGVAADVARARRESPRLMAWLGVRARTTGRTLRAGGRRLASAARIAGHAIAELSVLLAMLGLAAWRRAAGIVREATAKPASAEREAVDATDDVDADAPLGREESEPDAVRKSPPRRGGRTRTR
jgi:hypothetical protein